MWFETHEDSKSEISRETILYIVEEKIYRLSLAIPENLSLQRYDLALPFSPKVLQISCAHRIKPLYHFLIFTFSLFLYLNYVHCTVNSEYRLAGYWTIFGDKITTFGSFKPSSFPISNTQHATVQWSIRLRPICPPNVCSGRCVPWMNNTSLGSFIPVSSSHL